MSGDRWSVDREVIERNSVRCEACSTEVESTHSHDFRSCECGRVSVDGGKEYRRRCFRGDGGPGYIDTSIYDVFRVEYEELDVVSQDFIRRVGA